MANEFFDALPVNQAVKTQYGWHERQIEIGPEGNLSFTLAPAPIRHFERLLPEAVRRAPDNSIFEWRAENMALDLRRRIAREGGAALVIDYGHSETAIGDTLQAVARHAYADPLTGAGTIDLTAHVDFQALARGAEAMGAKAFGPIPQSLFLRRLGIEARAGILKNNASRDERSEIDAALERLTGTGRTGMGALFKVMAFARPDFETPPGFAA
jgi:SAM-dependent MidA family methyltransferase